MNCLRLLTTFLATFSLTTGLSAEDPAINHFEPAANAVRDSGYEGVTLLYNLKTDSYFCNNASLVDEPNLPASTFKIFSTLAALETGVIEGPDSPIFWDDIERSRTELNRDLTLREAFQLSAVPHFQQLVRAIGRDRMQSLIDANKYGNQSIAGEIHHFWLSGDLRVSPLQQIDFLNRLYHDALAFELNHMAVVKEIMKAESGEGWTIRAKTGLTQRSPDEYVGWWVGWRETDSNVIFFATMLYSAEANSDFFEARKTVTRQSLDAL